MADTKGDIAEEPPAKRLKETESGEDQNGSEKPVKEKLQVDEDDEYNKWARAPFDKKHKISRSGGKFHLLIGVTGSVAAIKLKELIVHLYKLCQKDRLFIKVVVTECGRKFLEKWNLDIEEVIYEDKDEWNMWQGRGDPILHVELRKWADCMIIAPLDANSLAKIAHGECDNLLTSIVRAWDPNKNLHYAPAMNSFMWDSPLTFQHRATVKDLLRFKEIPPIEKDLMCGDSGMGAMASTQLIASIIAAEVKNKFAVYTS